MNIAIKPENMNTRHALAGKVSLISFEAVEDDLRTGCGQGPGDAQGGIPGFFEPNPPAFLGAHYPLPPAFPAVRIGGELYWDGGILSNTPTETIFDDNPRRNSLIFAVHMWNPMGPEPDTIWEVLHRHKDIQYSSRVASHIAQQRHAHKLRHVISELVKLIRKDPRVKDLAEYGLTQMHVVRLLAPRLDNENHTKDIDFSSTGIRLCWEAGYADTIRALRRSPWDDACDPLEGVILHEPLPDDAAAMNDGFPNFSM